MPTARRAQLQLQLRFPSNVQYSSVAQRFRSFSAAQQSARVWQQTLHRAWARLTRRHGGVRAGTCAGLRWPEKQALTIQYHPEAAPGPHDADICFDEFINMMRARV